MDVIVRLRNTKGLVNISGARRILPRLAYTPAALSKLPEGLPVTIRRAGPDDEPAIAQLAEIDEAPIPAGDLLVAEVGGELWAAASVDCDQGISDPFRPSGEILRALGERAGRRRRSPAEHRERRTSTHLPDTGPPNDGRSHPPVVRVPAAGSAFRVSAAAHSFPASAGASADPAAGRDVRVWREEHDAAVGVERAEHEGLGDERPDLPVPEVDGGDDEPALECGAVVTDDLRGRLEDAEFRTEVDLKLPRRLVSLGEGVDGDHPPDSHLDPGEVVELDQGRPNIAGAPPAAWLAWLALGTVYLVWGSTYLAIRVMVQTMPALLGAGARFLIAGLALYAWIWLRRGGSRAPASGNRPSGRAPASGNVPGDETPASGNRPGDRQDNRSGLRVSRREAAGAACVGILLTFGGNGLVTVAEQHISSSLAALVIASVPFVIVLLGAAIGQRASRGALIGVTIGLVGVTILILPGASAGGSGLVGAVLVVAAAVSWAAGSVCSTRLALPADLGLSTALQMTFGGATMIVAAVIGGEAGRLDLGSFSGRSIVAFGYLVVFGSIAAFQAYTWLLQHVPISRVSTYAYVNPMVAVLLGWLVLGESISPTTLVGASVIIGSVVFIVRSTRSPGPPGGKRAPERPMVATARRRV